MKAEAQNTPRRHDHRHRACWEGSWEGGGTASRLVEDTTCQRDGNVIVVARFLVAGGSIFNLWERQTPSFCNVVARTSDTPMQLRRQNHERNLASWQKISHRGQFRLRGCSTKLAREGGGRCFGSQVSSTENLVYFRNYLF